MTIKHDGIISKVIKITNKYIYVDFYGICKWKKEVLKNHPDRFMLIYDNGERVNSL